MDRVLYLSYMKTQNNKTMKAIIENYPKFDNTEFSRIAFLHILKSIVLAENEIHLRDMMKFGNDFLSSPEKFFDWGFGSSHMWVHEKGSNERLLIVEF